MATKGLSTGTLSLRFMQNAHRAKNLAHVEAEKALVKDDAEWEVDQKVRDAWNVEPSSNRSKSSVLYEASYLPFLFPSDADEPGEISETAFRVKGRRAFGETGGTGADIVEPLELPVTSEREDTPIPVPAPTAGTEKKYKKGPRQISGFASQETASKEKKKKKKQDPSKAAQNIIRDISRVGTDLRPPPRMPEGFIRPGHWATALASSAGDDANAAAADSQRHDQDQDAVQGARAKRQRDVTAGDECSKMRGKKQKNGN